MSLSESVSGDSHTSHTRYTYESTAAICWFEEKNPESLKLRFAGSLKISPLSILALKKIYASPSTNSCHTTYTFEPTAAICGNPENPESIVLILTGSLKFSPSFILTLKNISAPSSDSSCHTTY